IKHTFNTRFKQKLLPAFQNAERSLIYYMLQNTAVAETVRQELGADFRVEDHKIIVTYLYAFYEEGNEPDVSKFIESIVDQHIKQLITEVVMFPEMEEISDEVLRDYIHLIKEQSGDKSTIKSL